MDSAGLILASGRRAILLCIAIVVLAAMYAPVASATKYGPPERHDEYSWNGKYVLDIDPATEVHTVYAANDRRTPLWSFSMPVWHFPFLVSDDGRVVATVAWMHVKEDEVDATTGITFWNASGQFHSVPLTDLCDDPPQTQSVGWGPIGDFWRRWYYSVENHGDTFTLTTTRNMAYTYRYSDGAQLSSTHVATPSRATSSVSTRVPAPGWATSPMQSFWIAAGLGILLVSYMALHVHLRSRKRSSKDMVSD